MITLTQTKILPLEGKGFALRANFVNGHSSIAVISEIENETNRCAVFTHDGSMYFVAESFDEFSEKLLKQVFIKQYRTTGLAQGVITKTEQFPAHKLSHTTFTIDELHKRNEK